MNGRLLNVAIAFVAAAIVGFSVHAEESLLLQYDFDEGTGTVVKDASGNKLNGTIINEATYVKHNNGFALEFKAKGCVMVPVNPALDVLGKPGKSYTVEFWFKSAGAENPSLTEKWPGGTGYPWAIRGPYAADGKVTFSLYSGKGASGIGPAAADQTYKSDTWHHLAAVRDTAKNNVQLFIDGELLGETVDTLKDVDVSNAGPICIGARWVNNNTVYYGTTGQLDGFRIYGRALTEADVKEHYKTTK